MKRQTREDFSLIGLGLLILTLATGTCPTKMPRKPTPRQTTVVTVTDVKGVPIEGATVSTGSISAVTNLGGIAALRDVEIKVNHYCVVASGYDSACVDSDRPSFLVQLTSTKHPVVRGRLRVEDGRIVYPDGSDFPWRGITGFQLNERMAHAPDQARQWMKDRHRQGFTIIRVLVALDGYFTLSEGEGLKALPLLFETAAQEDIYIQLVAVGDDNRKSLSQLYHRVEVSAQQCAAYDTCGAFEIANEAYGTARGLNSASSMKAAQSRIPASVGVVLWGAPSNDQWREFAQSPVFAAHLQRVDDPWRRVDGVRLLAGFRRPAVDNEPAGFAEQAVIPGNPNRRETRPAVALAQGALDTGYGVGSVFHCQAGLTTEPLGPVQTRAAEAFVLGATAWRWGRLQPYSGPLGRVSGAVASYGFWDGQRRGLVVALGTPPGDPSIETWGGWSAGRQLARVDDVVLIEVRR